MGLRRVEPPVFLQKRNGSQCRIFPIFQTLVRCISALSLAFLCISIATLLRLDSNPTFVSLYENDSVINAVHDPHFLIRNPPSFTVTNTTCSAPPGTGEEGPEGVRALYKIYVHQHDQLHEEALNSVPQQSKSKRRIRLMCMVYTHSNRHDVLRAVAETYGHRCDGFLAASNLTDPSIGAFALTHDGPEEYGNMWNKVQKMWLYAYQHYLRQFDWFFICGDDTYAIPENLRKVAAYYEDTEKEKGPNGIPPLYLGASIPNSKNLRRRFCGGGAGYMLNQQAVLLLSRRILIGECPDAMASDEDIRVARCLDDAGVQCHDTNDAAEEVRFHHLDAQFHASWTPQRVSVWLWPKLQRFHGIRGNQSKLEQISNTSTTFHLVKSKVRSKERDRGMRRYHAILNPELCGSDFVDQVREAALCSAGRQAELQKEWAKTDI
ncbi:hypothetical protein IV203_018004 [Nitzschia inconspicua]|uniref:N-acetylgalactosaminide beta-1,3-galactosyltransferase n=1 Tax=Nitzschia inconspicua TaxID=303405 RepID=A0A9K3Q569_9STRA|nr:hypothetical protein IV203_018004 [Nitzschia inconspicua]